MRYVKRKLKTWSKEVDEQLLQAPLKNITLIGDEVWIDSEVMVVPGIKVDDRSVMGTRALVTQDGERQAIIGDNPSKMIRRCFNDHRIEAFPEIRT